MPNSEKSDKIIELSWNRTYKPYSKTFNSSHHIPSEVGLTE